MHMDEALESCNPYLFGSALHQLQDYFSHWNEGYTRSHAGDTMRAGAKTGGRSPDLLSDFFKGWHYEVTETPLGPEYIVVQSPYPAHPKMK